MPRAYVPRLIPRPKAGSFKLDPASERAIARTFGLERLPTETVEQVEAAVAAYRATEAGSQSTTVANTLLLLRQLEKQGPRRREALELLANDRAGVDDATHDALQNLAKAVLVVEPTADVELMEAARRRILELEQHPRIVTALESLRYFCGVLRLIFLECTNAHANGTAESRWHQCRQFTLAVFDAAGIAHADFDAHPERLTEYLGTKVP